MHTLGQMLTALGLLLAAANAPAQTVDQDDLRRCAALASSEEKLTCYESLARKESTTDVDGVGTANDKAAAPAEAPAPPVAEAPSSIPQPTPTAAAPPAVRRPSKTPAPEAPAAVDGPASIMATAPAADAVRQATTPAASNDTMDRLGKEHLEKLQAEPEPVTATVVRVSEGRSGVLCFHFDNGQVWCQTVPRRFQYPKSGSFEVTITTGMMGDYRLRIGDSQPRTRIRRVE